MVPLATAEGFHDEEPEIEAEPALKLEPIADLDIDGLFGQKVDESSLDDMFDLENLEKIAQESQKSGRRISFDDAIGLGILDDK